MPPRGGTKAQAVVVDEPDIHVEYDTVERTLAELSAPVPESEPSQKMATGSGPATPPTALRSSTPIASARSRGRA